MQKKTTISYSTRLYETSLSTNVKATIDKQMRKLISLKEIGQAYINWKAKKRHLQTTIDATTTSPSSPRPTLCMNIPRSK
jgi:hypothetical protein